MTVDLLFVYVVAILVFQVEYIFLINTIMVIILVKFFLLYVITSGKLFEHDIKSGCSLINA